MKNIDTLATEMRNKHTMAIDTLSTTEILTLINKEDRTVAAKVQQAIPDISRVVEVVCQAIRKGGKVIYVGAGTSGRIGILDAVECPPTYSTDPSLIQGIIAGGFKAIEKAVEGAEDREQLGQHDLEQQYLSAMDVVIGIAASGRTPYVVGALKYAQSIGVTTVSIASNSAAAISKYADIPLEIVTGPEVVTGSTRMKAATAHKLILNMISTTAMIKLGKVYENLMVDVQVTNYKLMERAKKIVSLVTGVTAEEAEHYLLLANQQVKPAIVMIKGKISYEEAMEKINAANGFVRDAIRLAEQGGVTNDTI